MNIFSTVAGRKTPRSKFDLSHEKKLSFKMGSLVPILNEEIIPGDKFRVKTEVMLRLAPMIAPVMHRVNVYVHYFFVPTRLIWDDYESFFTGGRSGTDLPEWPHMTIQESRKASFAKGRLPDYYGLPIPPVAPITQPIDISSLPFRAYLEIYNKYYRDPNLVDEIPINKSSGAEEVTDYTNLTTLRKRCWEKDYYTSALPWSQRGAESEIPINNEVTYRNQARIINSVGTPEDGDAGAPLNATGSAFSIQVNGINGPINIDNIDEINTGLTVNDLRKSVRLQEWLERSARGGWRYIEQVLSHFGVQSSDLRTMRPEYLGGGKQPVVISEVLNTTGPTQFQADTPEVGTVPQGSMAGHGISVGSDNKFQRSFKEHGYVIGLMSVLPKTTYQQGIHRMWTRKTKFDYYWPEFAQLGEQEVLNKEVYWDGQQEVGQEDETFGYQSRYSEYRYNQSTVHGDYRDNLNFYHMGRIFDAPPVLNNAFVLSDPTNRIFAVTDEEEGNTDQLWTQVYHNIDALRPMPRYNNPTL